MSQPSVRQPHLRLGRARPVAAICRAVVLGIAPDALIVDITHEVEKYNIRHGALMLWCALPFLPIGAHVCVVDPGVGTARRPIAHRDRRAATTWSGPDNGVLLPGAERLGGVVRAHQHRERPVPTAGGQLDVPRPRPVHARRGPPGARRAARSDRAARWTRLSLAAIDWPPVIVRDGELETSVIYRDTFGNVKLAGLTGDLQNALAGLAHGDKVAGQVRARRRRKSRSR